MREVLMSRSPVPALNGIESKLIMELHDQENKGEFIGFLEISLNNLGDTIQREEWFPLMKRKKKDRVNGEILLRTRITPEVGSRCSCLLSTRCIAVLVSFPPCECCS